MKKNGSADGRVLLSPNRTHATLIDDTGSTLAQKVLKGGTLEYFTDESCAPKACEAPYPSCRFQFLLRRSSRVQKKLTSTEEAHASSRS